MNIVDLVTQLHELLNHPRRITKETCVYSRGDIERWVKKLESIAEHQGAEIIRGIQRAKVIKK